MGLICWEREVLKLVASPIPVFPACFTRKRNTVRFSQMVKLSHVVRFFPDCEFISQGELISASELSSRNEGFPVREFLAAWWIYVPTR